MRCVDVRSRRQNWARLATLLLLALPSLGLFTPPIALGDSPAANATPPDAVYETWDERWTLNDDGSTTYWSRQHVRLNNDRAYDDFGDPRLTYNADTDKLEILHAGVRLPDGTIRELPDYSHVFVSPGETAGWPAFAAIRQHLLVMSGIEPGCVVELEYQLTRRRGERPFLAADVRLDAQFPVQKRSVAVQLPAELPVECQCLNLPEQSAVQASEDVTMGDQPARVRTWRCSDLPAAPPAGHAPPWSEHNPRFVFSTAGSVDTWLVNRLGAVERALDAGGLVGELAKEWTRDVEGDSEKLRVLCEKLSARFNYLAFNVDWQPAGVRSAGKVLASGYGLPTESAAVLLSLARAAGIDVELAILVSDSAWNEDTPQDAYIAAYVVTASGPNGLEIWHPQHGRLERDKRWAGHTLLTRVSGDTRRVHLQPWTEADESRCLVRGKVTVDAHGKLDGRLTIRASGLFTSSEDLRTRDQQKRRIQSIAGHVLPGVKVEDFSVLRLAPGAFEIEAQVKRGDPLDKIDEGYRLELAEQGPGLDDVPLPLDDVERRAPVRLVGPYEELVDLAITWPEDWTAEVAPASLAEVQGPWGLLAQDVTVDDNGLKLARHVRLTQRDLAAGEFAPVRDAFLQLQAEYARTLLLRKGS